MPDYLQFERGTLWRCAVTATARALRRHSLRPIVTRGRRVPDGGIEFAVRMLADQTEIAHDATKHTAAAPDAEPGAGAAHNPFLPFEADMFVADLSATHVCLLNKYTVIPHHLLMVTRTFVAQETALTLADFAAMWACLAEFEGLAFYNSGKIAGASQRHKHLQYAPLPIVAHSDRLPIEAKLPSGAGDAGIQQAAKLPFRHALAFFAPDACQAPQQAAERTLELYQAMVVKLGLNAAGSPEPQPYNLLATRRWLMIIPRTQEKFAGIAINALGYAGSLLVRNEDQFALLTAAGPLAGLANVGQPALI